MTISMSLYTTEWDRCAIGCGEPYVFLNCIAEQTVLFWCPSCKGIWDSEILDDQNLSPMLYGVDEFAPGTLLLPSLGQIQSVWKHEIIERDGSEEQRFREDLRSFFGDRIRFGAEKEEGKTEKGMRLD
jgi:hypothetical protein